MDASINQIKELVSRIDEAQRMEVIKSLQRLIYSLETPQDTMYRYGHCHLETTAVKIGFNLGIFKYLTKLSHPATVEEIAEVTGSDSKLLGRVLRHLSAIDAVDEAAKDQFQASSTTRNLSENVVEAGVSHFYETVGPTYQALPAFLQRSGHKNPTDETHTAFHDAWKTSLHPFAWFAGQPDHLAYFNDYMALRRAPELSWLAVYPINEEVMGITPDRALYVNIGGGIGHQCAQFKEKYPDIPGRVILQDLPHSIAEALPTPGVENIAHDIFQPQPVKGAKFYFLRAVLHDHPPHKVRHILENTKAAMAPDSVLLVDEMILPDVGVNSQVSSIDMTMLATFASMERTEAQWREAFKEVGLELAKTYRYNSVNYESVMDVRIAQQTLQQGSSEG